jgi:hypothetical protein
LTVRLNAASKAMALNNAGKTAPFGLSSYINAIPFSKLFDSQLLANLETTGLLGTELT